ncbi:myosin-2-like [Canna indica]|uniref:Myosin-2-like n=1 Tax=Canna indica TaxID=4628 RepID=A0AAQ3KWH9_9LILI|nr:myosin-2-like [Canna indica]
MSSPNAMAPVIARSTLEIMLDALRQRDERPQDLPPALPVRPTSRGRLPSSRRSVPMNLNLENSEPRRSEDKKEARILRNDEDVVIKTSIFGSKRIAKVEKREETPFMRIPELVSYEKDAQIADVSDLPVDLSSSAAVLGKKLDCGGSIKFAVSEVAALEDSRNQTLQVVLWVQKNFRGLRARSHYQQLKAAAASLQSFVRGERARHTFQELIRRWKAAIVIQKHVRLWFARTLNDNQQKSIILLQSVIRGWLARKHFIVLLGDSSHSVLKKGEISNVIQVNLMGRPEMDPLEITKVKNSGHHQIHPSVLVEVQSQILTTEAALRQKEEENAILKQQLQDYETRWSKYELRMKSMEEHWQKQLTSLQLSLAAARKSHAPEEMTKQPGRLETSKVSHYNCSEDMISAEAHAVEGTHSKLRNSFAAPPVRTTDSVHKSVIQLLDEFDQQRHIFDNDAGSLIEMKSAKFGAKMNPYEELWKLKARFGSWKKEYKMRLRHAKTELLKLGSHEEKARKKWWCAAASKR